MGAELQQLTSNIEALKRDFGRRVSELNAGFDRLERVEREIEAGTFGSGDSEAFKDFRRRLDQIEAVSTRLPQGFGSSGESIGSRLTESEAYKGFDVAHGHGCDAVKVDSFFPRASFKANELTGASLGNVSGFPYQPQRVPGIIGPPMAEPRIRDLLPVFPISEGAVEFVRQSDHTNAAAATAENTAKPQSSLSLEIVQTAVRTIAHWLPMTRQIVADAPALQAYVDSLLVYGLALVEDNQILNGDGTGTNLSGLLTDEDVQTINQGDADADDTKADTARRAITLLEAQAYAASGFILHPNDWEDIELLKDADGRYIWARVQETGRRTLWGKPVVLSIALGEGAFVCGAFPQAAAIWDREQSTVRLSDQHEDFFTKNLVAVLAEERLALTVYRPEALVLGTFTAAGS